MTEGTTRGIQEGFPGETPTAVGTLLEKSWNFGRKLWINIRKKCEQFQRGFLKNKKKKFQEEYQKNIQEKNPQRTR